MDPSQHERIMQVLGDALEVDPEHRSSFVEQACGLDRALRAEVERLLLGHGKATVALPTAHGAEAYASTFLPPSQIGPYRIVRPLGEGGMGVVYLAVQEHPVRRPVALKLIRPGMSSREVIARFESERQALAMMSHPGVAHVYDAGTFDSGRPYFVMEYVDGQPITDWCDANRASLRQRLELLVMVCDAIQHAHQKGIVHRDLKPTNVLIAMQDGQPAPKVIDFGIAKAMEQRLSEHSLLTEQGQLVGTPEYMSPEQAGGEADIDTRTDVYALGVLLYELLSGLLPFDRKMLRSSAHDEMRRLIRELDAPRPSTRLGSIAGDEARRLADARRLDPGTLRRALVGDLDWIVMKSLEKERDRRYPSPSELAADVERHLRDEPVTAGPPTTRYRLQKFVRRHRAAVGAAAVVVLALVGGMATTTWQAVRARRAEREIRIEQQKTLEQKALAETQSALAGKRFGDLRQLARTFMFDVDETLQSAGPTAARQKLVGTAIAYLDALAKESPDPDLARELIEGYLRVGSVQFYPGTAHLGDPRGAMESYQKALGLAETLRAARPNEINPVMLVAGCRIYLSEAQSELNEDDAALASLNAAREMYEMIAAADNSAIMPRRNIALTFEKLSDLHRKAGRSVEALAAQRQCLETYERLLRERPADAMLQRDVQLGHDGMARFLIDLGRYTDALPHATKSQELALERLARDPDNPREQRDVLLTLMNASKIHRQLGHAPAGVDAARKAVEISRRMVDADRRNVQARRDLAGSLAVLAHAQSLSGATRQALDSIRESQQVRFDLLQQDPPDLRQNDMIPSGRAQLAGALLQAGILGEALAEAQAAVRAQDERWQADPGNHAIAAGRVEANALVAQILLAQGRALEAVDLIEQAVASRPKPPDNLKDSPTEQRFLAGVFIQLGDARTGAGKLDAAVDAYAQAAAIYQKLLDSPDAEQNDWLAARLASALTRQGMALVRLGKAAEANEIISAAMPHASSLAANPLCGTDGLEAAWRAYVAQSMLQQSLGNTAGAEAAWQAGAQIARDILEDPENAQFRSLLEQATRHRHEVPATQP